MKALTLLPLLVLFTLEARADVVSPEPEACPRGSEPATCHGGPHCALVTCGGATDAACEAGFACTPIRACIGEVSCAGHLPPGEDPNAYLVDTFEDRCEANACTEGTCTTVSVCLPGSTPTTPSESEGGGCASGGAPSLAYGLALVMLDLARRRWSPRCSSR